MTVTQELILHYVCDICNAPMPNYMPSYDDVTIRYAPIEACGVRVRYEAFGTGNAGRDVCADCRRRAIAEIAARHAASAKEPPHAQP